MTLRNISRITFKPSPNLILGISLALLMLLFSIVMPTPGTTSNAAINIQRGQLLASNCAQCHGTNGQSGAISQLAGMGATDMFNKMKDQQTHNSIMGSQARGYSDTEIKDIAAYFASVKKL